MGILYGDKGINDSPTSSVYCAGSKAKVAKRKSRSRAPHFLCTYSLDVMDSLLRMLASAETSTVLPRALGKVALFSSKSDYFYSPGLITLSFNTEPNNSGANS